MHLFCSKCGKKNDGKAMLCVSCKNILKIPDGPLKKGVVLEGRYEILSLIKTGGMGAVYKARDTKLKNICAVKELLPPYGLADKQKQAEDWFRREAEILAALDHANLPKIIDYFVVFNRYYLVMTFIEGEDLEIILNRDGNPGLPEEKVRAVALQVLEVLDYLHSHDSPIIYRDIKPANIMIHKDGRAILIDFGIARAINPDSDTQKTSIGTLGYVPEEQCEGQAEPRSDIYALGATMHHLITGVLPASFNFQPPGKLVSLSPELEKVIMKSLENKAVNRFSSAKEMMEALNVIPGTVSAAGYKRILAGKGGKKRLWIKSLSTVLILALLYFAILGFLKLSSYLYSMIKGSPWKNSSLNTETELNGISFIDVRNGWIVGAEGLIFNTTDGGSTWRKQESHLSKNGWLCNVTFIDLHNGWAVGREVTKEGGKGIILNTSDGGKNWTPQECDTPAELRDLYFIDINRGWVSGYGGTILYTSDGGINWEKQESRFSGDLEDICFVDGLTGWAAGAEKTGGNRWGGVILHTEDGGKTWKQQDTHLKGTLYGLHFIDYDNGWATGIQIIKDQIEGFILYTNNGGKMWRKKELDIKLIYLTKVYFIDNLRGWVAGLDNAGKGIILHTSDGGKTWKKENIINLPLLNNFHFINANNGWAVGPDGMIFNYSP